MLELSEHAEGQEVEALLTGLDGAEVRFGERGEGICVAMREAGNKCRCGRIIMWEQVGYVLEKWGYKCVQNLTKRVGA